MKIRIPALCLLIVLLVPRCNQHEELLKTTADSEFIYADKNTGALTARSGSTISSYDQAVLSNHPIAFWNAASGNDLTANGHSGAAINAPEITLLPNGDRSLVFNGTDQYVEIASAPAFSVSTTGILTLEAWVRPDVLAFPNTESSGYVHWMGKGTTQNHEYAARMYTQNPTGSDAGRTNRISGSVFSLNGASTGSYYQAASDWPVQAGEWIHYVFTINTTATAAYPDGYTKLYVQRKNSTGAIISFTDLDALNAGIVPAAGTAPFRIGTKDMRSFFQGAIGKVAVYNYELTSASALAHAEKMFNYDSFVLADHPVAFWNDATGEDLTLNEFDGIRVNNPAITLLPNGDLSPVFDINKYIEIADAPEFSVPTTGILTLEAWIRADKLHFDKLDGTGYVHWMGKGEINNHEYAARMYGQHPVGEDADRANRISGYAFNPAGSEGVGSYYQASSEWPVQTGEWIHYVLIINTTVSAAPFSSGFTKLYIHRKNSNGSIVSFTDKDALISHNIVPEAGNAPFRIGTRNLSSFFQGAIGKVAIYNYELSGARSLAHAQKMFY